MNQERVFKVLLGPVVSEKSAQFESCVVFKVLKDASKAEIKEAIEQLYKKNVESVRTLNVKGKTKRTRFGMGQRSDWKKAYVRLEAGQEIDFEFAE